jgi:DNA topoisomerase-6 subunit B
MARVSIARTYTGRVGPRGLVAARRTVASRVAGIERSGAMRPDPHRRCSTRSSPPPCLPSRRRRRSRSRRGGLRAQALRQGQRGTTPDRSASPPRTWPERQREISVSEFFTKNRHLLGFDSPLKALLTAVKEAVDNSLDACEEAGILPEIVVEISPDRRGPLQGRRRGQRAGIVKDQIPKVFGKLLYGSKFHKLSQTRGQQGIGISGRVHVRPADDRQAGAHRLEDGQEEARDRDPHVDGHGAQQGRPARREGRSTTGTREHGTRVEIEMEAKYQKGMRSVDMYLKQTAIANPHLTLHYVDPGGEKVDYERSTKQLPKAVVEIKPHPHGVELGRLIQMLQTTNCRSLSGFLQEEFSRVGSKVAHDIIDAAGRGLSEKSYPSRIAREEASALHDAIQKTKISSPSTDCIAPIGEELVLAGLKKEIEADFYTAITRPAAVYRGNPFQIEVGIAYGKPGGVGLELNEEGRITKRRRTPNHRRSSWPTPTSRSASSGMRTESRCSTSRPPAPSPRP